MKMKRPDTLPEWFDLEKYRGCAGFGPVEWWACLEKRQRAWEVVPHLVTEEPSSTLTALAHTRARPLAGASRTREIIDRLATRRPVRSATWVELGRAARIDRLADSEQAHAWRALGADIQPTDEATPAIGALMIPGWLDHEADAAVAIVDLSAPYSVVMSAFQVWLKQARAAAQAARNRPKTDKWAEYGLLPYLDLQIWCLETDANIPEPMMAKAIHPPCEKEDCIRCSGTDWIGDTLAPLARSLMADLSPLRALAAENIEEWAKAQRSALPQGNFQP